MITIGLRSLRNKATNRDSWDACCAMILTDFVVIYNAALVFDSLLEKNETIYDNIFECEIYYNLLYSTAEIRRTRSGTKE